jgi:hypothetical protein
MHSLSDKIETTATLPNFLLVGAAKCGTSSLYHYLQQHPDIFMSPVKEPRFFSNRAANPGSGPGDVANSQKSVGSFNEYVKLFQKSKGKKAVGEASVDTMFHFERTIPAIQHYLHDPRIVIILRNPVDRAYSAYNYHVRDGRENLSFADALIMEEKRKEDGYMCMWQYQKGGLYAERVRDFQKNFTNVQVLLYDDLKKNVLTLLRCLYAFLDVQPDFVPDTSHRYNVSGIPRWSFINALFIKPKRLHKVASSVGGALLGANRWIHLRDRIRSTILLKPPPMDPEIAEQLRQYYCDDILTLQDSIGRDLSSWIYGENK